MPALDIPIWVVWLMYTWHYSVALTILAVGMANPAMHQLIMMASQESGLLHEQVYTPYEWAYIPAEWILGLLPW